MGLQAQQPVAGDITKLHGHVAQSVADLAGLWLSCQAEEELDSVAVGETGAVTFKSRPDQTWTLVNGLKDGPGCFVLIAPGTDIQGKLSYERFADGVEKLKVESSIWSMCGEFWQKIAPPGMNSMRVVASRHSTSVTTGSSGTKGIHTASPPRQVSRNINLDAVIGRWIVEKENEQVGMVLVNDEGELAFVGNQSADGLAIKQADNSGKFSLQTPEGHELGSVRLRRLSDGTDCLLVDRTGASEKEYWRRASAPGTGGGSEELQSFRPSSAAPDMLPAIEVLSPIEVDLGLDPIARLAGRWQGWKDDTPQGIVLISWNGDLRFADEDDSDFLSDEDDLKIVANDDDDGLNFKVISHDSTQLLSLSKLDGDEHALQVIDSHGELAEVWRRIGAPLEPFAPTLLDSDEEDEAHKPFEKWRQAALLAEVSEVEVEALEGEWSAITDAGKRGVVNIGASGTLTFAEYPEVVGLRLVPVDDEIATFRMLTGDFTQLCSFSYSLAANGDMYLFVAETPDGGSEVWKKVEAAEEEEAPVVKLSSSRPLRNIPTPSDALKKLAGRWVAKQGDADMGMVLVSEIGELSFIGEPDCNDLILVDRVSPQGEQGFALVGLDDELLAFLLPRYDAAMAVECLDLDSTLNNVQETWFRVSTQENPNDASPLNPDRGVRRRLTKQTPGLGGGTHASSGPVSAPAERSATETAAEPAELPVEVGVSEVPEEKAEVAPQTRASAMPEEQAQVLAETRVDEAPHVEAEAESRMEGVRRHFRAWDRSGRGVIERQQLMKLLQILDPSFESEAVVMLLHQCGQTGEEIKLDFFFDWLLNSKT
mmetsp:Transcript_50154/g.92610  ORF Transcript_50154/g.92610 Transcript_50154/m.92610 type:complete len:822 (+) Transcript_50154:146-2611(+)